MNTGLRNILILATIFLLYLTSSTTLDSMQKMLTSSLEAEDPNFHGSGYYSQAVFYALYAFCNWASPSIINVIGHNIAMAIGILSNVTYILSYLFPHTWGVYIMSGFMGFGEALLWTAEGSYVISNSTEKTITRYSGIFYLVSYISVMVGSTILLYTFNGSEELNRNIRITILVILVVICGIALIGIIFLPRVDNKNKKTDNPDGPLEAFVEAFKLLFTKNMLVLSVIMLYWGMEMGFLLGVYSTCLGFTKKFANHKELVGLHSLFVGIGELIATIVISVSGEKLAKKGRKSIVVAIGCILSVLCFTLMSINLPYDSSFHDTDQQAIIDSNPILAVFCSFLLGATDSITSNMIFSLVGSIYVSKSTAAVAITQFIFSMGSLVSFVMAQIFSLYYQLGSLIIMVVLGTICYIKIEITREEVSIEDSNISEYKTVPTFE